MSEWIDKCWGKTRELVNSPFYSRHELDVVANGYCSLHYHKHRANRFVVESATIQVIEMFGPSSKKTILGPGATYDVPSLVPHMFVVHRSGTVIEEYFSDRGGEINIDDITRIVEGGTVKALEIEKLPHPILQDIWISESK